MKKVLIVFGGNSEEHYISCKSARFIIENINKKLFNYEIVGIDFNGIWYKFNDKLDYLENGNWRDGNIFEIDNIVKYLKNFDVVFPVTHGNYGEDGKLQGFFELFNIKFVGSKTSSSVLGYDKCLSKMIFDKLNIPQVPYMCFSDDYNINEIINTLDFPLIVKPCRCGSSIGISTAHNKKELVKAIKLAKKYDNKFVVEKFIKARELECAVIGDEYLLCSKPGEIKSSCEFYDYDSKYVNKSSETNICNNLPLNVYEKLKDYAVRIFIEFDCSNYSRIDFFYNESDGSIYINEINTLPGFTEISMFPKLLEHENISYCDLITTLINNA